MTITETHFGLFKVVGVGSGVLLGKEGSRGSISSISICCEHQTSSARVDLYLSDGTNSFYIIKEATIPPGATLMLNEGLSFDNNTLALEINQVEAVNLSIIIK